MCTFIECAAFQPTWIIVGKGSRNGAEMIFPKLINLGTLYKSYSYQACFFLAYLSREAPVMVVLKIMLNNWISEENDSDSSQFI